MAIFDSFKKKKDAAEAPKEVKKAAPAKASKAKSEKAEKADLPAKAGKAPAVETQTFSKQGGIDLSMVIREPRITEKATMLAEKGAYVFDVHQSSTKPLIAQAIRVKFGVTPEKIRMMNIPAKRRQSRMTGVTHTGGAGRKAVVYLKKGDKIEFV
jgi:large subunit ribosomal protein L23